MDRPRFPFPLNLFLEFAVHTLANDVEPLELIRNAKDDQ